MRKSLKRKLMGGRGLVAPRTVNPVPELVVPDDWAVIDTPHGCVDLAGKRLEVPHDESRGALSTRLHEYGHIRFTEGAPDIAASRLKVPVDVIQVVEDARVNLAIQANPDLPPLDWGDDLLNNIFDGKPDAAKLLLAGTALLGTVHYGQFVDALYDYELTDNRAAQFLRDALAEIRETATRATHRCRTMPKVMTMPSRNKLAKMVGDVYKSLKGADSAKRKADRKVSAERERPRDVSSPSETVASLVSDALAYAASSGENPIDTAKEVSDFLEEKAIRRPDSARGNWGKVSKITTLPLKARLARSGRKGRQFRASDEGLDIERPERKCEDGKVFRVRRSGLGVSCLIDISGSMSLSADDVKALLSACPNSIVATYSGRRKRGHITIIGRGMRCVDDDTLASHLSAAPGGNIVDGPALDWLGKQRTPRLWVSDGIVTGHDDSPAASLFLDAADKIKRHKIMRVENLSALLR